MLKKEKCSRLLTLLSQYHDKQEELSYQNSSERLKGYSYCEVHCLDFISTHEMPNVTKIAASLKLARGTVSRILRRLERQGLIRRFQIPSNHKEIYFALTEEGADICRLHELRHQKWLIRDEAFLSAFSPEELDWLISFFTKYNQFLEDSAQKEDIL